MSGAHPKGRLSRKYVVVLVALVGGVLIASGLLELYLAYQETRRAVVSVQREKAVRAAERIEQFVGEIERDVRGTTHAATGSVPADLLAPSGFATEEKWRSFLAEQREIAFLQVLRNVPAVMELRHIDESGRERIRVSRLALDAIGSGAYYFETPAFRAARGGKIYYGPVTFHNDSEPYMQLAVPSGNPTIEVTVADINLKAIWDVISRIRVGQAGYAYVVDSKGRLIAHPDVSMVLQMRDLSALPQVKAALGSASASSPSDEDFAILGTGLDGTQSLATHAAIPALSWFVIVEQPLSEVYAPLRIAMLWGVIVMVVGLALTVLVSFVLARRMVAPIRTLQAGAARIGAGELDYRIDIRTGDELEALAAEFNHTTEQLQESQRGLEQKVQARTEALMRSVEEMRVLGEVGQAVSSTLDLDTVLMTIVAHAVELSKADAGGTIYEFDENEGVFMPRASHGMSEAMVAGLRSSRIRIGETSLGICAEQRAPYQMPDIRQMADGPVRDLLLREDVHAVLAVPLLREEQVIGGLVIRRKVAGEFSPSVVTLLQALAGQSVLAIQNARLFHEIEEKGRQLEAASQHKSQFLASMSHELRTPLNAILGFNEMILGEVYGPVPADMSEPLQDIQSSGKHLLRLINNVLDLAKIEAGRMELALADYSVQDTVESVRATLKPLAADKGLEVVVTVPADIPLAHGDSGRITQCLVNLAGNSLKFTKAGRVEVSVDLRDGLLTYRVSDTGIGIPADKIASLFAEFKQTDATIASEYGGSGLGLSITKKFVEMHGGRIWVESELSKGSTFIFELPLRACEKAAA